MPLFRAVYDPRVSFPDGLDKVVRNYVNNYYFEVIFLPVYKLIHPPVCVGTYVKTHLTLHTNEMNENQNQSEPSNSRNLKKH